MLKSRRIYEREDDEILSVTIKRDESRNLPIADEFHLVLIK